MDPSKHSEHIRVCVSGSKQRYMERCLYTYTYTETFHILAGMILVQGLRLLIGRKY